MTLVKKTSTKLPLCSPNRDLRICTSRYENAKEIENIYFIFAFCKQQKPINLQYIYAISYYILAIHKDASIAWYS